MLLVKVIKFKNRIHGKMFFCRNKKRYKNKTKNKTILNDLWY